MTNVLWELPRIEVFGRGKYRTVDYDLWNSGVELSAEATKQVRAFADGYHAAYYREMRRANWWVGKISGQIQVLRCHSQDCSARLLLHITDPRNHDPEYHAKVLDFCRKADESLDPVSDLSEMRNYADSWTQARQDATAAYPAFVDDPLGDVPRLPTPPPIPTGLRPCGTG